MKYQQLENLECGWKWGYLVKKSREGVNVTKYLEMSEIEMAIEELYQIEHAPTMILAWIEAHLSAEFAHKLKQAIRAKRKRHFNAERLQTKKKSIDLDYYIWEKLSQKSAELGSTLSETIEYLLSEAARTEKATKHVSHLKEDLFKLLDGEP